MPAPLEISVGAAGADVVGSDARAIQMAIDAAAFRGGGTVRVLPGQYILSGPVRLRSNVMLIGDREKTVLRLGPLAMSPLAVDADIGQKEITPTDASGFREGMGIVMRDNAKPNPFSSKPLMVTRVAEGKLFVEDYIEHDITAENGGLVVSYFPLIHGRGVENVVVDGFTLDGQADRMDGLGEMGGADMWSVALYLGRSRQCIVRNVTARNCAGDGIQCMGSEHMTIEDCEADHNSHFGIHLGEPLWWATARRCDVHHNGSDGLYLCWGVHQGAFEDNQIHHNGYRLHRNGISIGHKDTDNLIGRNHVYENAKHGICFRVESEANGGHRNVIRDNIIENNGRPEDEVPPRLRKNRREEVLACGVFVRGITHDLMFERNVVRETRHESRRYQYNAFYLGKGVLRVKLTGNEISEHPGGRIVDDSGSPDNDLQGLK